MGKPSTRNLCERGPAARRPVGFARPSRAATPPPPIRHAPAGTPAACVSREARPRAPDPDGVGSVVKHACCCSFCECVLPLTWHPAAPHPFQAACRLGQDLDCVHGDSFSKLLPRVLLEPSVGPARTTDLTAQPLDQPVRLAERTPLFVYPYVIRAYSPRPATIRHAREPRAPARNVPAAGERHAAAAGVKLPVEHGKQEGCLPAWASVPDRGELSFSPLASNVDKCRVAIGRCGTQLPGKMRTRTWAGDPASSSPPDASQRVRRCALEGEKSLWGGGRYQIW
jgi:hypothetical protein